MTTQRILLLCAAFCFAIAGNVGCNDDGGKESDTSSEPSETGSSSLADDTSSQTQDDESDSETESPSNADTLSVTGESDTDDDTGSSGTGTGSTSEQETDTGPDLSCEVEGLSPSSSMAGKSSYHLEYVGYEMMGDTSRELRVQIYDNGPTEPGTYSLEGTNYKDCGLCVLAYEGCTVNQCDKAFYARTGTVEITAIGEQGDEFAATLHDVVLEEVTINPTTFESTPVPDGKGWCVDGYSFDETIDPYFSARCADPWLTCVGDTVEDFSLKNCQSEEMVSMSSLAENQKALWFVLVTGWCSTCKQYLPTVVEKDDQYAGQGLEVVYVFGENAFAGRPSAQQCRSYAAQYTSADRFFLDHNGEYSFATMFEHMWPYIGDDGAFSVPWSGVIDPQTFEYIYGDGSTPGAPIGTVDEYVDALLGL